jgi:hypothetical protein
MLLTIIYTIGERDFTHSGSGEAFTRFLRNLESQRIPYRYAPRVPAGSNLFAGIVLSK